MVMAIRQFGEPIAILERKPRILLQIGHIKMVENGVIRPESFYNYLTAWYNVDNMMYYVSQASFQPAPPYWQMAQVAELGISLFNYFYAYFGP